MWQRCGVVRTAATLACELMGSPSGGAGFHERRGGAKMEATDVTVQTRN
jgi:hypothetical protein